MYNEARMWKPVLLGIVLALASVPTSPTAPAIPRPETMKARQCGLCREAEKHPLDAKFFFLKDNNPRKPNRWLLLPRAHKHDGPARCRDDRRPSARALWRLAIAAGEAALGRRMGDRLQRRQGPHAVPRPPAHRQVAQGHRLDRRFIIVIRAGTSRCPKTAPGSGSTPPAGKLHVHLGEQTCRDRSVTMSRETAHL